MAVISRALCGAIQGVDAFRVDLELDFSRSGMPAFIMVGLAEGAVKEARERVFSALRSGGFRIPVGRITVNLAPADRKKGGSSYDLPLALALLCGAGALAEDSLNGYFFAGELSLSGELRPVSGVLPLAILARNLGVKGFLLPVGNAAEAAIVDGLPVYGLRSLNEAAAFLSGQLAMAPQDPVLPCPAVGSSGSDLLDFADVKGQEHAKRAIEIAAAGGHNLLLIGPPGSGKTMLAKRLPSVLPQLSFEEALEVTKIYSVAGFLAQGRGLVQERPFRAPHHTISEYGLIGGGLYPRPGEISLAHRGVLFLDELLEFRKQTLEVLRQPLEDGSVCIARAGLSLTYPSEIMLVAAMNPCPCGYFADTRRVCSCSSAQVRRYRSRLSGPLLDRMDLHVEVPAVLYEELHLPSRGRTSQQMRRSVEQARSRQKKRYKALSFSCNAELSAKGLEEFCQLGEAARTFLGQAVQALHLSARAYTRILRISRTIADMEEAGEITTGHVAEAVSFRVLDRADW